MADLPPIRLFGRDHAVKKAYTAGTHRARSPRETLGAYMRHMAGLGITRLANLTGLDTIGLPVYAAIRPNSRSLASSQGKGFDVDSAKASALMESIELWHAEHVELPLHLDSYQSLRRRGATVVDIEDLPRHARAPLRPDLPILWVEGFDLLQQRTTWVPLDLVTLNSVWSESQPPSFYPSSNGLASGNHLLEAVVHGLCEVIERDAEALWRHSDDFRLVDLHTVTDPTCTRLRERLERAGVTVAAWEMTVDTAIPVFGSVVLEPPDRSRWRALSLAYGFGCHLAPEIALVRAITESVQTRTTYISGSRDDLFREDYEQAADEALHERVRAEISEPGAARPFTATSLATDTFEGDVAVLLEAVSRAGVQSVVVVDLTRPELGIPVVKVVVPGLEGPFEANCAPGKRIAALAEVTE